MDVTRIYIVLTQDGSEYKRMIDSVHSSREEALTRCAVLRGERHPVISLTAFSYNAWTKGFSDSQEIDDIWWFDAHGAQVAMEVWQLSDGE